MKDFFKKHKKIISFIAVLAGLGILFPLVSNAQGVTDAITGKIGEYAVIAVGHIVKLYVSVIGWIVVQLVNLVIKVASYNEFVTSPAVTQGWTIVRDVVNMFFIVILLVIAFATIFNVREYKYQAMLPRLLIMAVVINFSRTIAGIFIDFGQVVMLTFVNGFKSAAGGNFVNALRLREMLEFDQAGLATGGATIDLTWIFVGFILAAIMVTVAAVVLVAMLMILVMRIVILWFLIVLSPIAFLASVWPSGRIKQKYAQWWDMFLDNIMVGPLLAFFLWLSLLVLGSGDIGQRVLSQKGVAQQATSEQTKVTVGYTKAGTEESMISFVMAIGMLIGSLYMAQSMRSAGSGIAGGALNRVKASAKWGVKKATAVPKRAAKGAYEASGARSNVAALRTRIQGSKFAQRVGLGSKEYKAGQSALRDEKALRRVGLSSKADALRTKLALAEQKGLSEKGLTDTQVIKKHKISKKGSVEKEALARELASRNAIRRNKDFKQYSEGDKRLEFALRSASLKAGNKLAFAGYQEDPTKPSSAKKDIEDVYHRQLTSAGARKSLYTNIKSDAQLDETGEMYDDLALEKLATLESEDYNSKNWDEKTKQGVRDAFVLAKENDPAKFAALKLEDKFNKLESGSTDFAAYASTGKIKEVVGDQERLRAAKTKGAQEAGILKKTEVDKTISKSLTEDIGSAERVTSKLHEALALTANMDAFSAGSVQGELDDIVHELETIATNLDTAGNKSGQYNEAGNEMSNLEVLQDSRLYKGVTGSKQIVDEMVRTGTEDNKERREAAVSSLGVSARDMNAAVLEKKGDTWKEKLVGKPVTEEQYVKTVSDYKIMEARARNRLKGIPKITDKSKRGKEAGIALKELGNAFKKIENQAEVFPRLVVDIEALKTEIERLKRLGAEISQGDIDKMSEELDKIRGGRLA